MYTFHRSFHHHETPFPIQKYHFKRNLNKEISKKSLNVIIPSIPVTGKFFSRFFRDIYVTIISNINENEMSSLGGQQNAYFTCRR